MAQVVPAETIRQAVREYVRSQLLHAENDVVIEFRTLVSDVPVPASNCRVLAGNGTLRNVRGTVSVPVDIICNDSTVRRQLVSIRVRTFGDVYVAARQLDRSAILTEGDLLKQRVETTTLADDAIADFAACAGMQVNKILNAGTILRSCYLTPIPVVRTGDRISVLVRSGRVTLRSEGTARESGGIGSTIAIQVPGKNERLRARIVSASTAEIIAN